jgi:hypothetical protein
MTATPLVDRLRALALHMDLPECAEAADRIEALEGHIRNVHRPRFRSPSGSVGYWTCSAGCSHVTGEDSAIDWKKDHDAQAHPSFAAHVDTIIAGTLPWQEDEVAQWHASHLWPDGHPNKGHATPRAEVFS